MRKLVTTPRHLSPQMDQIGANLVGIAAAAAAEEETRIDHIESSSQSDPRKTCIFCQKTFNHPGSLGRHLDLKRGTRIHPQEQVDQVRGNVKRRGDAIEVRARRAERAKQYNSRDDVKQRARIRRREKEIANNAKQIAKSNFINRLGQPPVLSTNAASFAYCVVYFLPPREWPNDDEPPSTQTYAKLKSLLNPKNYPDNCQILIQWSSIIDIAFNEWQIKSSNDQLISWNKNLSIAAKQALGHLSLYDFGSRDEWLLAEEKRLISQSKQGGDDDDDDDDEASHDNLYTT